MSIAKGLGEINANQEGTNKTRPRGNRYCINISVSESGSPEGLPHNRDDIPDVFPGGELRYHPPISVVDNDLRVNDIGQ